MDTSTHQLLAAQFLDDDPREAFVLTQLHSLRYDEAAAVLGVPIGTIRSRMSQAHEQLLDAIAADAARLDISLEPIHTTQRPCG